MRNTPGCWPRWGRGVFNDAGPVRQVQRGGDPPTLCSVAGWHRWPRPTEEAAEAFSARLSPETTRPEAPTGGAASAARAGAGGFLRGGGRGGGGRPGEQGLATPVSSVSEGNAGPHFIRPALGGEAGALGVAGQEGVKGPEGPEGSGLNTGSSPPTARSRDSGNAEAGRGQLSADAAIFLRAGVGGRAGPGAAGLGPWWVPGCSPPPKPLACPPGTEGQSLCGAPGRKRSTWFRMRRGRWRESAVLGRPGEEIDGGQEGGRPECGQCGQCWLQATSGWRWGRGGGRGEREGKF